VKAHSDEKRSMREKIISDLLSKYGQNMLQVLEWGGKGRCCVAKLYGVIKKFTIE
jgi:hypothetical protein